MKYFLYIIALCIVALIPYSCKQNQQQENTLTPTVSDTRIDTIFALFYNYRFTSSSAINAEDIKPNIPDFTKQSKGIIDATITDTTKIRIIKEQIDQLRKAEINEISDARISLVIKHRDGTTARLSLCGEYANRIFYNNKEQEPNNKLVFYIKNYIGYYPWFIGDDLFSMPELNDRSFMKEPFVSSDYYKQYQAALAAR